MCLSNGFSRQPYMVSSPVNRHTNLTVVNYKSYSCCRVCTPVKAFLYVGLSSCLLAACVRFLCQLPSDLSILSCLLREGWIPLSEQYSPASFGFVKLFTSFSCAFWEENNTAFHKCHTVAKVHPQIKNWNKSVSHYK